MNIVINRYRNNTYINGTEMNIKLTECKKLLAKRVYLLSYIDIFYKRCIVLIETKASLCREEKVTRPDPQTLHFDKILNFWAAIVIHVFYILSKKIGQQSTLFESLCKHFCIHCFYFVKDSKQPIKIQLSTTPCISM